MLDEEISKRIQTFFDYGNTLNGAKVYYRDDWQTNYFDLCGKQFGMMSPKADSKSIITLKNTPERNEELREMYQGIIIPGYYANKKYWNSISLSSTEVSNEFIQQLIQTSYELVYAKLTKRQKEEFTELS